MALSNPPLDTRSDSEKLDAILMIATATHVMMAEMQAKLDDFETLLLAEIEADALADFEPEGAAN